ncbi:MAG TPA: acyl-CoA dehydrogenase family protein, partial [Burkholderiales bacterium]|nr:acyl-CoA dehydrogenase family protein [Burkholderiales bacterium]
LAGGELYRMQLEDLGNEPVFTPWDAWGRRIDRVEITTLWRAAERIAAERGIVAAAYDGAYGAEARVHQFTLAYLFAPSTDLYACPLAMTDGAARALIASGNQALIGRALPHLTTRDPAAFWTSGQWMTEAIGGSDVGLAETLARQESGTWRLYGRKWFASAIHSQVALTLARPEGNPPGGKGLALFYVETRTRDGEPNGIRIEQLKGKLGTRKVPTAQITLDGASAQLVCGTTDGVRNIAPVLNVTRIWNSVTACALMRRGLALARDYASRRVAFGAPLAEQPLHLDTLAGLQAEFEAAFHLSMFAVELLGRAEDMRASEEQLALLRILVPVAKLTTARQAVAVLAEIIEAFGGIGYVEETGLPALLRDAHVLPIWEGTTNVLALDALRAVHEARGLNTLVREVRFMLQGVKEPGLLQLSARVERVLERSETWFGQASAEQTQAGARRFALTLGRTVALALLARQAQWALAWKQDRRPLAAALRFAATGIDELRDIAAMDAGALARDD